MHLYAKVAVLILLASVTYNWTFPKTGRKKSLDRLLSHMQSRNLEFVESALLDVYNLSSNTNELLRMREKGFPEAVSRAVVTRHEQLHLNALAYALEVLAALLEGDMASQHAALGTGIFDPLEGFITDGSMAVQTGAALLVAVLAGRHPTQVREFVQRLEGKVVATALNLVESGGLLHEERAVVAGCRLISVLLDHKSSRDQLLDANVVRLLYTVLVSSHATNYTVVGAALSTLNEMADRPQLNVLEQLLGSGFLSSVVDVLRSPHTLTVTPALALVGKLSRKGGEDAADEVMESGIISMCSQVFFNVMAHSDWRKACLVAVAEIGNFPPPSTMPTDRTEGARFLMSYLLTLAGSGRSATAVLAACEAVRDVARLKPAALAIVELEGVPLLVRLAETHSSSGSRGSSSPAAVESESTEDALPRCALLTLTVLATHKVFRSVLVDAGVLEVFLAALKDQEFELSKGGTAVAAAGLVSILEPDTQYHPRVLRARILEIAVHTFLRSQGAERKAAERLITVLAAEPQVAMLLQDAGIPVQPQPAKQE